MFKCLSIDFQAHCSEADVWSTWMELERLEWFVCPHLAMAIARVPLDHGHSFERDTQASFRCQRRHSTCNWIALQHPPQHGLCKVSRAGWVLGAFDSWRPHVDSTSYYLGGTHFGGWIRWRGRVAVTNCSYIYKSANFGTSHWSLVSCVYIYTNIYIYIFVTCGSFLASRLPPCRALNSMNRKLLWVCPPGLVSTRALYRPQLQSNGWAFGVFASQLLRWPFRLGGRIQGRCTACTVCVLCTWDACGDVFWLLVM